MGECFKSWRVGGLEGLEGWLVGWLGTRIIKFSFLFTFYANRFGIKK